MCLCLLIATWIVLEKVQTPITPTPSTKIVAQSIVTLSHLTNSATAVSLVVRPALSTPKVLCQLISSQQMNLIIPALNILHGLASTQASLKHLVISNRNFPCVAIDLILPTIFNMFSTCSTISKLHSHIDVNMVRKFITTSLT